MLLYVTYILYKSHLTCPPKLLIKDVFSSTYMIQFKQMIQLKK